MADEQPLTIVEGAVSGDVEDEIVDIPKSAEDRKAAVALSSLDQSLEDDSERRKGDVDQEAVMKAVKRLGGTNDKKNPEDAKKDVKKLVKVDPADIAFLIAELDLSKAKATELLKAHESDVVQAMKAYVRVDV